MSVSGPHPSWQRYALPLIAGLLICAGAVGAADASQPSGKPLWDAYPLDTGSDIPAPASSVPAPTTTTSQAAPLPRLRGDAGGTSIVAQIAFFGCLGAVVLMAATAMGLRVARRRRAQATCEIWWSPGDEGGAFWATALERGDAPRLVAASRRFERSQPGAPDEDVASRQVYAELVRQLVSEGWEPYERGTAWWEMRLRRAEGSSTPREAIHG
jgi:hypothetical protein